MLQRFSKNEATGTLLRTVGAMMAPCLVKTEGRYHSLVGAGSKVTACDLAAVAFAFTCTRNQAS